MDRNVFTVNVGVVLFTALSLLVVYCTSNNMYKLLVINS